MVRLHFLQQWYALSNLDIVIGKSIGGGIPSGAYGITEEIAQAVERRSADGSADIVDVGGVGGTLAGNALSGAAIHATLEHVLTDATWPHMIALAADFCAGVNAVIGHHKLPWSCTQLGCRAEYRLTPPHHSMAALPLQQLMPGLKSTFIFTLPIAVC